MQLAFSLIFSLLLFAKVGGKARLAIGIIALAGHIYRAIGIGDRIVRNSLQPKKRGRL